MGSQPTTSTQGLVVTHSLTVKRDLTWILNIHNHLIDPQKCAVLQSVPKVLSSTSLNGLIELLERLHVCCGQPDSHFLSMIEAKKGRIVSANGNVSAYMDSYSPVSLNGQLFQKTVRTSSCELLSTAQKCSLCKSYRNTLRAMYHQWSKKSGNVACDTSSHSNYRYLNTPEKKAKMYKLKQRATIAEKKISSLQTKIKQLTKKEGVALDVELNDELLSVMKKNDDGVKKGYPEGSFARLFWEEQQKTVSVKDSRQYRWHPLMIKWCLNLKLISSSAYHTLRTSGFMRLPSERTLQDYTHYFKSVAGFHADLNKQLEQEIDIASLPESKRYVTVLVDEMKIKEDLVYDKHTGHMIGFTSLGEVDDILSQLEKCTESTQDPTISNHILVLMVRGVFFKLEFPYAHFATKDLVANTLFTIVWEAVYQLEAMGLKVICVTGDGASPNRKLFRMNSDESSDSLTYKTHNPFADPKEERSLFFISDPPHLMKTTRNCWSHSGFSGTRLMAVS